MTGVAAAINGFALQGQVAPSENQLITLTYGQLREIVSLAIDEATAPIIQEVFQEVHAIRNEFFELQRRVIDLEAGFQGREGQQPNREIAAFKPTTEARSEEIRALEAELEALEENTAKERAYDRQRLAALEHREPNPTPKTLGHVDELYNMMRKEGHPPLSMARAARLLGLSKRRLNQLLPQVRQDQRFDVVRDPHHKQRLLIRLRKFAGG